MRKYTLLAVVAASLLAFACGGNQNFVGPSLTVTHASDSTDSTDSFSTSLKKRRTSTGVTATATATPHQAIGDGPWAAPTATPTPTPTFNSNNNPWYLIEPAPCAFGVKTDGVSSSWVDVVSISSAVADVYYGVYAGDGLTLLQSWHKGLYNPGVNTLRLTWPTSLHPSFIAAGGFVNGVLYRSDTCGLLY